MTKSANLPGSRLPSLSFTPSTSAPPIVVQPQDAVGTEDGSISILIADRIEAGAHVLKRIRKISTGFSIDSHANAHPQLQVSRNVRYAGSHTAIG